MSCGASPRELFAPDALDERNGRASASRLIWRSLHARWSGARSMKCCAKRLCSGQPTCLIRGMASAVSTPSISATCSPRCSSCSARIRGRSGDGHAGGARGLAAARAERAGPEMSRSGDSGAVVSISASCGTCATRKAGSHVGVSPTYSGLPGDRSHSRPDRARSCRSAGFEIRADRRRAVAALDQRLAEHEGARKLRGLRNRAASGIRVDQSASTVRRADRRTARAARRTQTQRVSEFGSTPCKALYRCTSCREPFDYFKCI